MIATSARPSARCSPGRIALVILALITCPDLWLFAQAVTVSTAGEALKIHAPGFGFLKGEPLARLKDGRSVRVELAVMVLPGSGRSSVAESRQLFALSYDLWEERFAVTVGAPAPRSISHLTSAAAEAWCIEQLAIPLGRLGTLGRDRSFWIRLEYRILDGDSAQPQESDAGFTLQGLIDVLSRRDKAEAATHSVEAGPFRLPLRSTGPSLPR